MQNLLATQHTIGALQAIARPRSFNNDERELPELWRRLAIAKRPAWQSLVSFAAIPVDWAFDKVVNFAEHRAPDLAWQWNRKISKVTMNVHTVCMQSRIETSACVARNYCSMSSERLSSCLGLLEWTCEDLSARYEACWLQIKHLNPYIAPQAMNRPRPQWVPDPGIWQYLQRARDLAEQIDRGLPPPHHFAVDSLTGEQAAELVVGLEQLSLLFEAKRVERAVMQYVKRYRLVVTLMKIGMIVSPVLMILAPKTLAIQLVFPLLSVGCIGSGMALHINIKKQYRKNMDTHDRISWLFTHVIHLASDYYHAELARREQSQPQD